MRQRVRTAALAALAALIACAAAPPAAPAAADCPVAYEPAEQPPFGGAALPPAQHRDPAARPAGLRLAPEDAIAIADRTETVSDERAETPSMAPRAYTRGCLWEIRYLAGETPVALVLIDDRSGRVLEAWRDHQVETKLARGYPGAVAGAVNSPWVWIPLCVLFVAPFFDPRRPFRLVHLDLLAIVGLSVTLLFFNRGEITLSVPLVYPVLAYLFARMLWAGIRPSVGGGKVVPVVPVAALAIAAVLLAGGRVALNAADSTVIDVGLAGVVGADRIEHGEELYEGTFTTAGIDLRGDVYGPANYLAYLPFEQVLPWSGEWDDVPAAHAAAIAFDLLTALALLWAGIRLRPGRGGRELGVALAFAWLACPWTLYTMNAAANDSLVALLVAAALAALSSPLGRGALIGLATAAKLGPAALVPLFASGTGDRRPRGWLLFALAFAGVVAVVTVPLLPDGGPREIYDRTLGYQASRGSPFSVWGLAPSLDWLETLARGFAVVLALAVAFYPRRRGAAQVAALGAAVVIAAQVAASHWFYFYVVWFLPLVLVAAFLPLTREPGEGRSGSQGARGSAS